MKSSLTLEEDTAVKCFKPIDCFSSPLPDHCAACHPKPGQLYYSKLFREKQQIGLLKVKQLVTTLLCLSGH